MKICKLSKAPKRSKIRIIQVKLSMNQELLTLMNKKVTNACITARVNYNRLKQFIHMNKKLKISSSFKSPKMTSKG